MKKILVPVCIHTKADEVRRAADEAIAIYRSEEAVQIHLLSVQVPLTQHVADYFDAGELRQIHMTSGKAELAPVKAWLTAAGTPCLTHVEIGRSAPTIVQFATDIRCDRIVIGKARKKGWTETVCGTLADEIRHLLAATGSCRLVLP